MTDLSAPCALFTGLGGAGGAPDRGRSEQTVRPSLHLQTRVNHITPKQPEILLLSWDLHGRDIPLYVRASRTLLDAPVHCAFSRDLSSHSRRLHSATRVIWENQLRCLQHTLTHSTQPGLNGTAVAYIRPFLMRMLILLPLLLQALGCWCRNHSYCWFSLICCRHLTLPFLISVSASSRHQIDTCYSHIMSFFRTMQALD